MVDINIREKKFQTAEGDSLLAIRDLGFTVGPTEFVCLVGPSGCGKTTTLRILLGLDTQFDGHVVAGDETPKSAAVFQEPRLLPWRTVEQNVRLALPPAERGRNLDTLFDTLGLTDLRRLFPGELSLGLARRAAIARAFAFEPSLLILDEPFVSLDDSTAARLRDLLLAVWGARPTAVVMVTHNLHEAVGLADRILLLSPRPASIRGEFLPSLPRPDRDPAWIAAQVAEIARMYPDMSAAGLTGATVHEG